MAVKVTRHYWIDVPVSMFVSEDDLSFLEDMALAGWRENRAFPKIEMIKHVRMRFNVTIDGLVFKPTLRDAKDFVDMICEDIKREESR